MFKKSALAVAVIAAAAAVLTPSPSSAFIPRPYYPAANEIPTSANVWDPSESLSRITEARAGDAGQQQRSHRTVTVEPLAKGCWARTAPR